MAAGLSSATRRALIAVGLVVLSVALGGTSSSALASVRHCQVHRSHAEEELELPFVSKVRTSNATCGEVLGPNNDLEDEEGDQYEALVNRLDHWNLPRHFRLSIELDSGITEHWKCTSRSYFQASGITQNTDVGDVYGRETLCTRTHQWIAVTTANEP
jgi:hypothetical protein